MGQTARVSSTPAVNMFCLQRLETHFIAPEIYRRDDVAERQAKLARIVATSIVPRLLKLQACAAVPVPTMDPIIEVSSPSADDVAGLADIVLGSDLEAAAAYIVTLRDRGLAMETLFVELLEPTARHLGEMWDRDECDFIDVTLGIARLQKLLALFNGTHALPGLDERRNVLMAMAPGNQHSFGLTMVQKFLVAAGWQVEASLATTSADIAAVAQRKWFAVAGLTAGSDQQLASLAATIVAIRQRSRNRSIGILVGGPMFTANPALANEVGADATAPNAPTAVIVAQKLFDLAESNVRGMAVTGDVARLTA